MKKSKFNETKILAILKEAEAGMAVSEISRKYGISSATFYTWKPMPKASQLNEVWSMDFMSDMLSSTRAFRTFNVLDDFNREGLTVEIDTSLPSARIIRSLEIIGAERGFPRYIRSDNGPEYTSRAFRKFCCSHRIRHRRIEPGKPQQNSFYRAF
jgi:putative transposase